MLSRKLFIIALFFLSLLFVGPTLAQNKNKIPAPEDVLGFKPGDDRKLASWNQVLDYFQKLDQASERVIFETLGKSTMDKPFVMATISAPENLKRLEEYKKINAKLADPRTIKSADLTAKRLIKQGKTIVLITCGVHSTEVGSYLSSLLIAHRLATSDEPLVQKILQETIVLLVPSLNPDGVDIVKDWYDKTLGTPYEGTDPPALYHKYTGHDNNRDWYAFTQVETQITVDKIHNVWHPQIVHDIHQMGSNGARLWLPPYMQPVEPNVPKQIVEGYTELGQFMQKEMLDQGFTGLANDSIFDAWTPARAYSHYHGGVRILSETASAALATPVTINFDSLRAGANYDSRKESKNFPRVWRGGEWRLRDITNYMTTAAFSLMNHASSNRERWLERFYEIGKEAVRPRKRGEVWAYVINLAGNAGNVLEILKRAGVEYRYAKEFKLNGKKYDPYTAVIRLDQPYAAFAKTLLEPQKYPNLLDDKGQPISPYDVTAHNLALLNEVAVDKAFSPFVFPKMPSIFRELIVSEAKFEEKPTRYLLYKSNVPTMDEGWTRWVFEEYGWMVFREFPNPGFKYLSVFDKEIRDGNLYGKANTIIFPDQSANAILNGHRKGAMPDEYTGGVGPEGVKALREFAEKGGTLVFLNRACDFAIEQFGLPVRDVTKGLRRSEFYIPGSILRAELDQTHPIAKGLDQKSIAWFENSPAFEITKNENVRVVARYPETGDILLSGWAFGIERLKGKAALVEITVGKGKIILFGFRPQYRGQSLATFPLLFNAITNK
jgi:hypothetical protein